MLRHYREPAESNRSQRTRRSPRSGVCRFRARGEYEHCFTLEGPRGEFMQLTATVAEHIARAIDREQGQERSYDSWAYDMLDDAVPAFHRQPFATVT